MAIEVVDRLAAEVDGVSKRFDELDKRMRKFETAAAAGAILALFFGITTGLGAYFVEKLREETSTVTQLSSNVVALQNAVSTISSAVEKAGMPVLSARVRNFSSASAPPHSGWSDYQSDMQALSNFVVEYLTLAQNRNAPITHEESTLLFSELDVAADAATERAKVSLKSFDDSKNYAAHLAAPQNFKNLLSYLKRRPDTGFSDEELHCYLAAFPNWYYHITHKEDDSPNTPECQKLLGLGKA
ncbi:MAG TPA: hypothetical protein VMH04_14020 [Candidatus Solibacter sp.]|nr:hypothetical protein [Candidatus Solibacter sp.]